MLQNGLGTVARSRFLDVPHSRVAFQALVNSSQLLNSLGTKKEDNISSSNVNAISSLPLNIKSRKDIYNEVQLENPSASAISVKFKQSFKYAKSVMSFYKAGVRNVWENRKTVRDIRQRKYHLSGISSSDGKDVKTRLPNFTRLTKEMSLAIYLSQIENDISNKKTQGDVIKEGKTRNTIDTDLFSLTRHEYQLLKRTPSDFIKLPAFAIIVMIFFEFTPLMCLAFPEITPSTCVLPMLVPRLWNSNASLKLYQSRKGLKPEQLETVALKNAYNLPVEEARLIAQTLKLISKYIPVTLYPVSILRKRLQDYYNYLKVDNYYLAALNGKSSGNIWNLTDQELIKAALERNLILDIKATVNRLDSSDHSVSQSATEEFYDDLRYRLFCFIADFDNFNIGYIGLTHHLHNNIDAGHFSSLVETSNT